MDPQIIIVYRDIEFRDSLKRILSGLACRIISVKSVSAAIKIASFAPICVMVSDASIQEPNDGEGLALSIHEQNPDARCFLIVDEELPESVRSENAEPWLRFVQKPISMLRFSADLADALHRSSDR